MDHDKHLPCEPQSPNGIITLTTDFGTADWYAGALKGVLLSINPQCRPIDLTHGIPPQDIQAGLQYLAQACPLFPAGTVHIAVVDPGVGSSRRPIIVVTGKHCFIGPDNGLFTGVMQSAASYACIELTNTAFFLEAVSSTFHGRDIFAPVAAHITRGIAPLTMGRLIDDPVMLDIPAPAAGKDGCITGAIVHIDHFGNLITNIAAEAITHMAHGGIEIACSGSIIRTFCSTYTQACAGELFGMFGSSGMLEISVKNASARLALKARRGQAVTVRPQTGSSRTKCSGTGS